MMRKLASRPSSSSVILVARPSGVERRLLVETVGIVLPHLLVEDPTQLRSSRVDVLEFARQVHCEQPREVAIPLAGVRAVVGDDLSRLLEGVAEGLPLGRHSGGLTVMPASRSARLASPTVCWP